MIDRVTKPVRVVDDAHPDHHLWLNGRVWWIAFTFHTADGRKHRVRKSLGTNDVEHARAKRDEVLERYASVPGWTLALRFASREREECPCRPHPSHSRLMHALRVA